MPESSRIPVRAPSVPNSVRADGHVEAVDQPGLRLPVLGGVLGV